MNANTRNAFERLASGEFEGGLAKLNEDTDWHDDSDDLAGPFRLRFPGCKGWGEGLLIASLLKRHCAHHQKSVEVRCEKQLSSLLRSNRAFELGKGKDGRCGRSPWAVLKQALLGELLTLPFVPLQFEESGRHQTESRLRIGLAWASRTAKGTDATSEKAVPQERFLALFDGLDAEFVSFQREPSSEESNVLEGHLGARILADAVLDRSDQTLVLREVLALACMVTVSATSAHIAAAFGVPVILVAARRKHQQWFWRAQGEHGKAFYPTVQVCLGEGRTWWECCLEQARDQLRATLNAVRIAG